MKVIIDNGHGEETQGKRSPDGKIREYAYARKVKKELMKRLKAEGIECVDLVPEEYDVKLSARCYRANQVGGTDNIVISIHLDALGTSEEWTKAHGWSARVAKNASAKSKLLANCLAEAAEAHHLHVKHEYPDRGYWVQNLAICRDTKWPAVLTENLFQNNKEDAAFLLTEEGFQTIVDIHVDGIKKYLQKV